MQAQVRLPAVGPSPDGTGLPALEPLIAEDDNSAGSLNERARSNSPVGVDDEAELLTAQVVADRLKIGKSTVYMLCRQGELPYVAIHRSVRIPARALARWLQERMVNGSK